MSLIGPRPDPPDWLEKYPEDVKVFLNVKPGITGYSQAYYRNSADGESRRLQKLVKMSYDMYAEGNESDAIFLEKAIDQEMNEELREALQDLDDFLFGY